MRTIKILVTGGGTGGHVSPALAVIQTLQETAQGADWTPEFRYVGSRQGVEKGLVEAAGIPFVGVQSGKLRRAASLRGLLTLKNLSDAFRVPVGIGQAVGEVRRFRPDVVLATGGYVSVPTVIAAGLLRRPVLIHEQTVQVGLANRIAARFATRIALTFEGAALDLPPGLRRKTFVTGNPVRSAIFGGDRARAVARFGFDSADDALPTVYVTGGALGAQSINRAVESALPALLAACRVIHQCGRQDGERMAGGLGTSKARTAAALSCRPVRRRGDRGCLRPGRSGRGPQRRGDGDGGGRSGPARSVHPAGADRRGRADAQRPPVGRGGRGVPAAERGTDRPAPAVRGARPAVRPVRLRAMGAAALTLAAPEASRDLAQALLEMAGLPPAQHWLPGGQAATPPCEGRVRQGHRRE